MANEMPIYLDYQATTPCDERVVDAMMPYFINKFGNPHSRNHAYGWDAEQALESSRIQVASIINADTKEIIFTSGATESNNLALKGVAEFYQDKRKHIITTVTEHKCVLETCRYLETKGFQITYLPVGVEGLINLQDLSNAMQEQTLLVSVMAVNNEIGVIQPLKEIGKLCRERGVFFHTDAAQAIGKIHIDVKEMCIDLLSISGHKVYGPKGVGALYVGRSPRVRLKAQMHGGSQERGMRSGTLSPALCVGLGSACKIAQQEMEAETQRLQFFKQYMWENLSAQLPLIYLNGSFEQSVPGNLNISFSHVEGESLMMGLKDLAVSSGSACTSASLEPSYVLRAIGVGETLAHTSLRISMGRFTSIEEVKKATQRIIVEVTRLREMSPLWEMTQQGIDINAIKWATH